MFPRRKRIACLGRKAHQHAHAAGAIGGLHRQGDRHTTEDSDVHAGDVRKGHRMGIKRGQHGSSGSIARNTGLSLNTMTLFSGSACSPWPFFRTRPMAESGRRAMVDRPSPRKGPWCSNLARCCGQWIHWTQHVPAEVTKRSHWIKHLPAHGARFLLL